MLGVYLNLMEESGYHLKELKKKADGYATRLAGSTLTAVIIRIFHRSIYLLAMRYSLPAITIDEVALGTVQNRVLKVMLQKNARVREFTDIYPSWLNRMGGLDMHDLCTEVGIEAIKFLCNSIYSDSEPGNIICLNIQYSQLESGIGEPLLAHPAIHIPYLTPTWVLSVRQFLSCHNMSIKLSDEYSIPLHRYEDAYMMQRSHLACFTVSQQKDINLVRLYLLVTTLAEITDLKRPSGISPSTFDGVCSDAWVINPLWPCQDTPTPKQQRITKWFLVTFKNKLSSKYLVSEGGLSTK
jgi:hypothetical protein